MSELSFYPVFVGTFSAMTILTYIAWKEHHPDHPRSLSTIVAQNKSLTNWFRLVTAVVSTLFTISVYFFIVPRIRYGSALFVVWTMCYVSDLLLATFPEKGTIEKQLHSFFAYTMAVGFVLTGIIFTLSFSDGVRFIEASITLSMLVLAILAQVDRNRFIFYELSFIYLSHISILIAAVALR